jgi:hypothetical protein
MKSVFAITAVLLGLAFTAPIKAQTPPEKVSDAASSAKVFSVCVNASDYLGCRNDFLNGSTNSSQFIPSSKSEVTCSQTVSFAVINDGTVRPLVNLDSPKSSWVANWVKKNSKKFPNVCFGEPITGLQNYTIVFSNTLSSFSGFQAVTRTNVDTSTTPVSGSGTVTDYRGGCWYYTYNGTVTTTTTTTTVSNEAYEINSSYLYATAYNSFGGIISQRYHLYSTQSGGDGSYSLGYNLGNAFAAINARGRLVNSVVHDISPAAKK